VRDSPDILAARAEVERSRTRVMTTAQELQERLSPKVLAKGALQGAKEKGADLAEDAVDAVKARPLTATGVAAAITMFLAREPLIDLAGRLVDGVGEKRKSRKARKAKSTQQSTEKTNDRTGRSGQRRSRAGTGKPAATRNPHV
jgi:ElaB/YqjD/DUF883 family membrane-anchored ribosome-binding protein